MRKGKRGFTYILNNNYIKLDFLAEHCEDLRMTKIGIIDESLTRLFNRVKPYKELLSSPQYKLFKKQCIEAEKFQEEQEKK